MLWFDGGLRSSVAGYPHSNTWKIFIAMFMARYAAGPQSIFWNSASAGDAASEFWSQMNLDPQSRFIGFDSFEGLPEDWSRNYPKGALSTGGAVPEIGDERVSFVKGWFQDTLPGFLNGFAPRSRLVVHSDSDLYSSTLFTLVSLHMLLVTRAVVILDDFSMATHVFRAFADYSSAFRRSAHPVAMTSDYAAQAAFVF